MLATFCTFKMCIILDGCCFASLCAQLRIVMSLVRQCTVLSFNESYKKYTIIYEKSKFGNYGLRGFALA